MRSFQVAGQRDSESCLLDMISRMPSILRRKEVRILGKAAKIGECAFPGRTAAIRDQSGIKAAFSGSNGYFPPIPRETATIVLPSEEPIRFDYIFVGWSEDPDATTAQYLPGAQFQAEKKTPCMPFGNMTRKPPASGRRKKSPAST